MSWALFNSLHSDDHQSSGELQRRTDGGASFPIIHSQLPDASSFFPTPPPAPQSPTSETTMDSSALPTPQGLAGVLNDLAEIGGSLKAGLSLLSKIRAVSRVSRIFDDNRKREKEEEGDDDDDDGDDDDDEDDYVAGINDEVVKFANQISERSACWTDFPLSLEDDFNFSDAQRQHAASIEYMVPSLRALRVSLQGYMTSEQFWMVYFILLLPKLDEYDMEILSSSQIVDTRNRLMQKLEKSKNEKAETSEEEEQNVEARLNPEDAGLSTSMNSSKKIEDESAAVCSDDESVVSARLSTSSNARRIREPSPGGSSTEWVQLNRGYESRGGGSSQRSWQSIHRGKDSDADSTASEWLRVYESD